MEFNNSVTTVTHHGYNLRECDKCRYSDNKEALLGTFCPQCKRRIVAEHMAPEPIGR